MATSQPLLDVGKLKDEREAEEFANRLIRELRCLGDWGNPEELWSAFKTTFLDVAGGCVGTHRRSKKNFVSQGTLDTIDQSHRARLNGKAELFKELRQKTVPAQRVDKEVYMCRICEGAEHHLWSSDCHTACRGIWALLSSKPIPRCTAVAAEGGGFLTEESELKAHWASYFGWLFQADPPTVELDVRVVAIPIADPPINCVHLPLC